MSYFRDLKQAALDHALQQNNVKKFQQALAKGARVDVPLRGSNQSVFEQALLTPGRMTFIRMCVDAMEAGAVADIVNRENPHTKKYPIHLAALSMDPDNLAVFLKCCPAVSEVINRRYKDRTALYLLFERLTPSNWRRAFACIKVLLSHEADINAADQQHVTPIEVLLVRTDSWRAEILEYCLKVGKVLQHASLKKKIAATFPAVKIPAETGLLLQMLLLTLEAKEEEQFVERYEQAVRQGDLSTDDKRTVLANAVSAGKLQAARKLLEVEASPEAARTLLPGMLAVCCTHGRVQILQWLLETIPRDAIEWVNEAPLLSLVISGQTNKRNGDFFACIETLLQDPRVQVNQTDNDRFTALHYAVKYGLEREQQALLAHGAYLGGEDLSGRPLICDINPYLLERHLNACVTDNGAPADDHDYRVQLNFANFQSPTRADEMLPIVRLAQSPDGRRLLAHPVITSILLVKWLRISVFFYANLALCSMFFVCFTGFMVFYYGTESHQPAMWFLLGPALAGFAYITLRELFQFVLNTRAYVRSLANYVEVLLIVSSGTALTLHFTTGDDQLRNKVEVCAILLSAVEFTVLLATIPRLSFSTHMVMLQRVAKNFIQCLTLYSMVLVGFAISFYTLFRVPNGPGDNSAASGGGADNTVAAETKQPNTNGDSSDTNPFNGFGKLSLALMKTMVMMTGEFEAADLQLHQSWTYYIVFGLFLFFVPIVLFNLMNGLAVYDATSIQAESERIVIRQKVFVINSCEGTLKAFRGMRNIWKRCFGEQPEEMMENFPYICILPNQDNTIEVPKKESAPDRSTSTVENGRDAVIELAEVPLVKGAGGVAGGATKDVEAAVGSDASTAKLAKQVSFEQEPTLCPLSGTMEDAVVKAARVILCSNERDTPYSNLQMQQMIYHLSQDIAAMNDWLRSRQQQDNLPPAQQAGGSYYPY